MNIVPKYIQISQSLIDAIDIARGKVPFSSFLEQRLRRDAIIKKAASKHSIKLPDRATDRRGKWERKSPDKTKGSK